MAKVLSPSQYAISEEALVLKNTLDRILNTTISVFESYGVPLPGRQYWCSGEPAEDCEQLVVVYTGGFLGAPGNQQQEPQPCNGPKSASIQVRITRNVPVSPKGDAPRPDRIQEAAEWTAIDSWVLLDNLSQYDVTSLGYTGSGALATVAVAPPGGGVQTTTLTLTLGVL